MGEYMAFRLVAEKPKTKVWDVESMRAGNVLGTISWYGEWRQYVFAPASGSVWSWDCLRTVQEFIKVRMDQRRKQSRTQDADLEGGTDA